MISITHAAEKDEYAANDFYGGDIFELFVPTQERSLWFSQQPKGYKSVDDW
jgi:hypothetical protein